MTNPFTPPGPFGFGFGPGDRRAFHQQRRQARREFREHLRDHLREHDGGPDCPADFGPGRAFGPGRCAQTMVARAQVILEPRGDDAFRLHVRGSFAVYLAMWLIDAAAGLDEDHGAIPVDQHAVLEVPPHRT